MIKAVQVFAVQPLLFKKRGCPKSFSCMLTVASPLATFYYLCKKKANVNRISCN